MDNTVIGTLAATSGIGIVGTFLIGRYSLPELLVVGAVGEYQLNGEWSDIVSSLQSVRYKLALVALIAISIFAGFEALLDVPTLLAPYFSLKNSTDPLETDITPTTKLRARSGMYFAGRCLTVSIGLILGIYQLVLTSEDAASQSAHDFNFTAVYLVACYVSSRIVLRGVVLYFLHICDRQGVWSSRKLAIFQSIYSVAQVIYIRSVCNVAAGNPSINTEIATMTLTIVSELLLAIYAVYWIVETFKSKWNKSTASRRLKRKRKVRLEEWLGGCLLTCYFTVFVIGATVTGTNSMDGVMSHSEDFGIVSSSHFEAYIYLSAFLVAVLTILPATFLRAEWTSLQEISIEERFRYVRYISHELRTPLNTMYLGLTHMDQLFGEENVIDEEDDEADDDEDMLYEEHSEQQQQQQQQQHQQYEEERDEKDEKTREEEHYQEELLVRVRTKDTRTDSMTMSATDTVSSRGRGRGGRHSTDSSIISKGRGRGSDASSSGHHTNNNRGRSDSRDAVIDTIINRISSTRSSFGAADSHHTKSCGGSVSGGASVTAAATAATATATAAEYAAKRAAVMAERQRRRKERGKKRENLRGTLEDVMSACEASLNILNNLLCHDQLDNKKVEPTKVEVPAADFLRECILPYRGQADQLGIRLLVAIGNSRLITTGRKNSSNHNSGGLGRQSSMTLSDAREFARLPIMAQPINSSLLPYDYLSIERHMMGQAIRALVSTAMKTMKTLQTKLVKAKKGDSYGLTHFATTTEEVDSLAPLKVAISAFHIPAPIVIPPTTAAASGGGGGGIIRRGSSFRGLRAGDASSPGRTLLSAAAAAGGRSMRSVSPIRSLLQQQRRPSVGVGGGGGNGNGNGIAAPPPLQEAGQPSSPLGGGGGGGGGGGNGGGHVATSDGGDDFPGFAQQSNSSSNPMGMLSLVNSLASHSSHNSQSISNLFNSSSMRSLPRTSFLAGGLGRTSFLSAGAGGSNSGAATAGGAAAAGGGGAGGAGATAAATTATGGALNLNGRMGFLSTTGSIRSARSVQNLGVVPEEQLLSQGMQAAPSSPVTLPAPLPVSVSQIPPSSTPAHSAAGVPGTISRGASPVNNSPHSIHGAPFSDPLPVPTIPGLGSRRPSMGSRHPSVGSRHPSMGSRHPSGESPASSTGSSHSHGLLPALQQHINRTTSISALRRQPSSSLLPTQARDAGNQPPPMTQSRDAERIPPPRRPSPPQVHAPGTVVIEVACMLTSRPPPVKTVPFNSLIEAPAAASVSDPKQYEEKEAALAAEHMAMLSGDKLFEFNPDALQSEGGSGLSLSIARSIVELHGGTISVKSSSRKSEVNDDMFYTTTFVVTLPSVRKPRKQDKGGGERGGVGSERGGERGGVGSVRGGERGGAGAPQQQARPTHAPRVAATSRTTAGQTSAAVGVFSPPLNPNVVRASVNNQYARESSLHGSNHGLFSVASPRTSLPGGDMLLGSPIAGFMATAAQQQQQQQNEREQKKPSSFIFFTIGSTLSQTLGGVSFSMPSSKRFLSFHRNSIEPNSPITNGMIQQQINNLSPRTGSADVGGSSAARSGVGYESDEDKQGIFARFRSLIGMSHPEAGANDAASLDGSIHGAPLILSQMRLARLDSSRFPHSGRSVTAAAAPSAPTAALSVAQEHQQGRGMQGQGQGQVTQFNGVNPAYGPYADMNLLQDRRRMLSSSSSGGFPPSDYPSGVAAGGTLALQTPTLNRQSFLTTRPISPFTPGSGSNPNLNMSTAASFRINTLTVPAELNEDFSQQVHAPLRSLSSSGKDRGASGKTAGGGGGGGGGDLLRRDAVSNDRPQQIIRELACVDENDDEKSDSQSVSGSSLANYSTTHSAVMHSPMSAFSLSVMNSVQPSMFPSATHSHQQSRNDSLASSLMPSRRISRRIAPIPEQERVPSAEEQIQAAVAKLQSDITSGNIAPQASSAAARELAAAAGGCGGGDNRDVDSPPKDFISATMPASRRNSFGKLRSRADSKSRLTMRTNRSAAQMGTTTTTTTTNSYSILIVDDSAPTRKMASKILASAGHTCDEAADGLEALSKYQKTVRRALADEQEAAAATVDIRAVRKANRSVSFDEDNFFSVRRYDIILMDFVMPNMDGPTATRELRHMGYTGPIIGVTGNALPSDIEHFMQHGATKVLIKPLRMREFNDAVDAAHAAGLFPNHNDSRTTTV